MAQNNSDEIDLGYLFNKISNLFRSLVKALFLVIAFFIKYIIVIIILILVGVAIGYYFDKNKEEVYNNEIIVIPNFDSADYLYSKINSVNAKIKDNDSDFLNKIFGNNFREVTGIEVEPIIDIYSFVAKTRENVEVFKILTAKQDIPDYIEDTQNNKYYKYHKITVIIKGKSESEKLVNLLMDFLNTNTHYLEYREVGAKDTEFQIKSYELMITQVDSILKTAADIELNNRTNQTSVLINDNSQINFLFQSKERYLTKLLELKLQNKDEDKVIKVVATNYNVIDSTKLHISNKIKYPFLLVIFFSLFFFIKYSYKKLKIIAESDSE